MKENILVDTEDEFAIIWHVSDPGMEGCAQGLNGHIKCHIKICCFHLSCYYFDTSTIIHFPIW